MSHVFSVLNAETFSSSAPILLKWIINRTLHLFCWSVVYTGVEKIAVSYVTEK